MGFASLIATGSPTVTVTVPSPLPSPRLASVYYGLLEFDSEYGGERLLPVIRSIMDLPEYAGVPLGPSEMGRLEGVTDPAWFVIPTPDGGFWSAKVNRRDGRIYRFRQTPPKDDWIDKVALPLTLALTAAPIAMAGAGIGGVASGAASGTATGSVGAWAPSLGVVTVDTTIPAAVAAAEASTMASAGYTAAEMVALGVTPSVATAAIAPSIIPDFSMPVTNVTDLFSAPDPTLGSGIPSTPNIPAPIVQPTGASTMDLSSFFDAAENAGMLSPEGWGVGITPTSEIAGGDFLLTSSTGGIPLDTFQSLGLGGMEASGALNQPNPLAGIFDSLSNVTKSVAGAVKSAAGAVSAVRSARDQVSRPVPATSSARRTIGGTNTGMLLALAGLGYLALKG